MQLHRRGQAYEALIPVQHGVLAIHEVLLGHGESREQHSHLNRETRLDDARTRSSQHASDGMVAETVFQENSPNEQPFKQPASKQPVPKPVKVLTALGGAKRAPGVPASAPASLPSSSPIHVAPQKQQDLALESTELKLSIDNLERERDFYYMKLREVEILCQQHEGEDVPFLTQVLEILYKTDDADEFVNPEEAQA